MRNEVLQNFKTCTRYTSNAEAEARGNICPHKLMVCGLSNWHQREIHSFVFKVNAAKKIRFI